MYKDPEKRRAYNKRRDPEKIREYNKRVYVEKKEEILARNKQYAQVNVDKVRARDKSYREKNKERLNALARARYAANPGAYHEKYIKNKDKYKNKTFARKKVYREENRDKLRAATNALYQRRKEQHKERRAALKRVVFEHYSGENIRCAECDVSDMDILTLDHINNDGSEHRKKIGTRVYKWLIANDFPEGFQVLCWNHNMKKAVIRMRNKYLLSQCLL